MQVIWVINVRQIMIWKMQNMQVSGEACLSGKFMEEGFSLNALSNMQIWVTKVWYLPLFLPSSLKGLFGATLRVNNFLFLGYTGYYMAARRSHCTSKDYEEPKLPLGRKCISCIGPSFLPSFANTPVVQCNTLIRPMDIRSSRLYWQFSGGPNWGHVLYYWWDERPSHLYRA